jgi:hypothetical protein
MSDRKAIAILERGRAARGRRAGSVGRPARSPLPFFGGRRPAVADFFVAEALDMTRAVIGERFDAALGRALRLAEMCGRLARRDAIARYVGEGRRPTRLTGSPNEAESLARIRRYVEMQVGIQP